MRIIIVDYCKGNLRSVQKSLELAGCEAIISVEAHDIRSADAIVLPGVGSFADASRTMLASGQMQAIRERVRQGVPFLGICLGMQLLFDYGDEGMPEGEYAEGLGLLRGRCKRIGSISAEGKRLKVPHVGWNQVRFIERVTSDTEPLFSGIEDDSNLYFTHSYQCEPEDSCDVLATVEHAEKFACAVRKGSVSGVQFHPEKSSHKGLRVLANFVRMAERSR